MIRLPKPESPSVSAIIKRCASNYLDESLKQHFEDSADAISEYTTICEAKMERMEYHQIPEDAENVTVSKENMRDLYTSKFAKKNQPGRCFYDAILVSAPNGRCAYCEVDHAHTLDHYCPKTHYPYLAVSPTNLIPACSKCNQLKSYGQFLPNLPRVPHPYFDNTSTGDYLIAQLEWNEDFPVATYFLQPNEDDDSENFKNALFHFKKLNLSERYTLQANDELSAILSICKAMFSVVPNFDEKVFLSFLKASYDDMREKEYDAWKTALYKNISINTDYAHWVIDKISE